MTTLEFVVLGLATYRITRLVIRDELLARPRNFFWKKFPPEKSLLGYLLTCPWCISIWVASILLISSIIIPEVTYAVGVVFALSAIAGLLTAHEER
jgi:hypothetical protein